MSLSLDSEEIRALSHASTTLLTPFSHATAEAWQRAACDAVQRAVGADAAALAITERGKTSFGGEPETVTALEQILPLPQWVKKGIRVSPHHCQFTVVNWTELYDESIVRSSAFYNDVVRPIRLLAPITMMEEVIRGQLPVALMVYFRDERQAAAQTHLRKEKLRLLFPAFSAGVKACVSLARSGQAAVALAEVAIEGIVVYDMNGRLVYENAATTKLLVPDGHRDRVRREMTAMAANLVARLAERPFAPLEHRFSTTIETCSCSYNVSAVLIEDGWGWGCAGPTVVLMMAAIHPLAMQSGELKARYRLSNREIETSQLIRRGYSSKQIASLLGISVHTARRHAESVIAKLGVHSRGEVGAKLGGY